MPINKIAYQVLEENQQNYINTLRLGQSVSDTGWRTYADAAGTAPVDGTGGTANITWAQNTTAPLSGDADLRMVKDAVNRQGEGVSIDFTISNRHLAKVLQITFDMELISGTYAAGDLRVYIVQDPGGTPVVIEPVGTNIELGIANQRVREIATFQTSPTVTSYRLCVHVASSSASAYTVDFANFRVWEPQQSIGAVITDWQSYTPTIQGNSGGTLTGFYWRRVGGNLEINGRGTLGTVSGLQFQFTLPSGLTIGAINSVANTQIGILNTSDATSSTYKQFILLGTSGNSYLQMSHGGDGMNIGSTNLLSPVATNNIPSSTPISLQATIPIAGWGSSVAMSSDTGDGRVVAARYTNSGTANNPILFATRVYDTHSAYNTTTGVFTAPISGYYRCSVSNVAGNGSNGYITINGTNLTYVVNGQPVSGTDTIYRNAGETLTFAYNGGVIFGSGILSIERISAGSQQISATETVVATATKESGSWSDNTIVTWTHKQIDTHSALNISTGEFTCPMSGKYLVNATLHQNNFFTPSSGSGFSIRKNGTSVMIFSNYWYQGSSSVWLSGESGSFVIDCVAGDKLSIYGAGSWTVESGKYTGVTFQRIGI